MKTGFRKIMILAMALAAPVVMLGAAMSAEPVRAEEADTATSISISPVSKILLLEPDHVYEDTFKVTNNGAREMTFEVFASPYSYSLSEAYGEYRLGFNNENAYTQITRWVTFADKDGNFVTKPEFTAAPGESVVVTYRISTPSSVPGGGQYAALFAHTKSPSSTTGAIRMEASAGLIVYGRSTGETIVGSEISGMEISFPARSQAAANGSADSQTAPQIGASAKIKNTGNVDFMATGQLIVESLFGQKLYETTLGDAKISVIPESELGLSEVWKDTPYCGIYKATWVVNAGGESQTISRIVVILPAPVVIGIILLLTFITIWIIVMVRKRKAHRSRLAI